MTSSHTSLISVEAMDDGRVHVSRDGEITALSVAWEGGVTSVELTPDQHRKLLAALEMIA